MIVALLLVVIVIGLITFACYRLSANRARYFKERNLKYVKSSTGIHNLYSLIFRRDDIRQLTKHGYNRFPDETIYGAFDLAVRTFVIRDPEAIKRICVKHFDYFPDHFVPADGVVDKLFKKVLISLQGEEWRQMRTTLSPAYTGSKMRQMFELVSEYCDEIVEHFTKKAKSGEKLDIEMKDFFSRYANDVIATCAFGIKVNSFANPNNELFVNGIKMMQPASLWRILASFVVIFAPNVAKVLKIKPFDETIGMTFERLILDAMEIRQKNDIVRPDMINLLTQGRKGNLNQEADEKSKEISTRTWSENGVVSQCLMFFLAGFDTLSNFLIFAAYELVANPDVQHKLYEEIAEVNEHLGGERINYDTLQKMKFLDQVVSEALRIWPPAGQVDRVCVKDYIYDDGKRKFTIEKGSRILFSLLGIQVDPKYFPNPDLFDPERFSDENKHNIISGTYFPFGIGPRNCIGARFAMMEVKAIFYYLLLNFSFEPNKDTQIPLKMKKGSALASEKGVHLELRPRKI